MKLRAFNLLCADVVALRPGPRCPPSPSCASHFHHKYVAAAELNHLLVPVG